MPGKDTHGLFLWELNGPFQSKRGVSIHKRVHRVSAGGEGPD